MFNKSHKLDVKSAKFENTELDKDRKATRETIASASGREDLLMSMEDEYTLNHAIKDLGPIGSFQLLNSLACILIFGVGSQFFYSIPFY